MSDIRVRFAPSPTGTLHIGGARTALFNWLFAKHNNGRFILRLEDTDMTRSTDESARGILEGLQWLGIEWDEGPDKGGDFGPYRQSDRSKIYQDYIQMLLDNGQAYYCFCTPEELQAGRERAREEKRDYLYDGKCRSLTPNEIEEKLRAGQKAVIRFKTPAQGFTVVDDLIRGQVSFNNELMDDFIIVKSDGWPTYNFAVVVDDASMKISHVIRAEEHLSNTPKQLLIYQGLNIAPPRFAHVSMILAPDRSKLSKRHGATSVQEFRDEGYLPEAIMNYLALLGWSSGEDIDFWKPQEIISRFSLDDISRSPAVYDIEKLAWMNGHYLAEADPERLYNLLFSNAAAKGWIRPDNKNYFIQVISLIKTRAKKLGDILNEADYFFEDGFAYDEKGYNKYFKNDNAADILDAALSIVNNISEFDSVSLEEQYRGKAAAMGIKAGALIHPTRLALSGRTNTPGLFDVMEILGRERCIKRLERAKGVI
ncbi:MAG: glutamate--tRNA ligase [Deltaproteobacteria bacterium]